LAVNSLQTCRQRHYRRQLGFGQGLRYTQGYPASNRETGGNMNKSALISKLTALALLLLLGASPALVQADDAAAARTIASILTDLNHFPSDEDKAALMEIAGDSSNSEAYRTIAEAVHNIQHSATDADKARLSEIIDNGSAPADARALAEIIMGISHVPSDTAKVRLAAIM
jgi:hypothetical protein